MADFRVRAARHEDIETLGRWAEESGAPSWNARALVSQTTLAYAHLMVAETAGEPVGFTVYWRVADTIQLHYIVVGPRRRKRGAGRALMEHILRVAVERNARRIELEVSSDNEAALALYRDYGFAEVGRRAHYYSDGSDALLMERLF